MTQIRRISFFDQLADRSATVAYFLQEGPRTCNASCTGCYAGAGSAVGGAPRGVIDPEVAYRDIEALRARYKVLLRGTEVLLNRDYVPLLGLAENDTVLTNGLILARFPERLDQLVEYGVTNVVITYPFDTPSSHLTLNDLLERRLQIDRAARLVASHPGGFVLQLSCQVTWDMIDRDVLLRVCDRAMELGAKVVRFVPYVAMSGIPSIDGRAPSKAQRLELAELVTGLKAELDSRALAIHTPGVLGLFRERSQLKRSLDPHYVPDPERLVCPAGSVYFAIGAVEHRPADERPYRDVTPCHFRMDVKLGRYYGGDQLELDHGRIDAMFGTADRSDCIAAETWYRENVTA